MLDGYLMQLLTGLTTVNQNLRRLSFQPRCSRRFRKVLMRSFNIPLYACLYAATAGMLAGQTQLYVTNAGVNNLPGLVDPATNALVRIFSSGGESTYLAVTGRGTRAYYADDINLDVAVIDTQTDTRLATIPMPSVPSQIVLSNDERQAYVVLDSSLAVIDTNTNALTGQIPAAGLVFSLAGSRTAPRLFLGGIGFIQSPVSGVE